MLQQHEDAGIGLYTGQNWKVPVPIEPAISVNLVISDTPDGVSLTSQVSWDKIAPHGAESLFIGDPPVMAVIMSPGSGESTQAGLSLHPVRTSLPSKLTQQLMHKPITIPGADLPKFQNSTPQLADRYDIPANLTK
jgi:hypothetical protein